MPLVINAASLASRGARSAAVPGGIRRISTSGSYTSTVSSSGGSLLSKIVSGFKKFGGGLVGKVLELLTWKPEINFKKIFQGIVTAIGFVYNFNWNVLDEDLDAQLKAGYLQLAGSVGGTVGNVLGRLVCGALPAAAIMTVSEPLALQIFLELGEDSLDEIATNIANLVKLTAKSLVQTAGVSIFKNVRSIYHPVGAKYKAKLIADGKLTTEQVDKAVEQRNQPWSFATFVNEKIETIPNDYLQELIEELIDEFFEACVDSGYCIAGALDSYFPSAFASMNGFFGSTSTVTIQPNRTIP